VRDAEVVLDLGQERPDADDLGPQRDRGREEGDEEPDGCLGLLALAQMSQVS
jgi:hypothetical protein